MSSIAPAELTRCRAKEGCPVNLHACIKQQAIRGGIRPRELVQIVGAAEIRRSFWRAGESLDPIGAVTGVLITDVSGDLVVRGGLPRQTSGIVDVVGKNNPELRKVWRVDRGANRLVVIGGSPIRPSPPRAIAPEKPQPVPRDGSANP